MRRLARERGGGRERKSDNGDGGSLLCVIKTRVTSANQRGVNFSEGVQGAKNKLDESWGA